ncbi:AraC family transcriptional regulator [Paenibacillus sepulcri]|uniref:AraC family transcriptional regulator n=2 Tax=Paenibacillus sepulcri TaxID=359917 RepID=A0ABS7C1B0_9BACL|nr:AraC family transcriptional regulator [Paenibacillus sepulcri]
MQLISRSYQEALSVSERHAFSKPEDIIPYSREEEEQLSYKYPLHLQKKLNEALIRDDTDAYEGIIADIEGYYLHTEGASLKHARSFFLSVVSDAVKLMLTKPSFDENIVKAGFDFCLGIDSYDDLPGMTGWLRGFLGKISDFMAGSSQGDVHRSVLLAAEYIREHFAEEISLNSVSTQFHVTSSYFSSMFKEIIGENFIEYLTGARMEKAKEYLTDSGMKIAEVGERVGYADSRYFSRLFRKHTGQMPSEYRQSPPASPADGQHEA